jgi:hypothetical protein
MLAKKILNKIETENNPKENVTLKMIREEAPLFDESMQTFESPLMSF